MQAPHKSEDYKENLFECITIRQPGDTLTLLVRVTLVRQFEIISAFSLDDCGTHCLLRLAELVELLRWVRPEALLNLLLKRIQLKVSVGGQA